MRAIAIGRFVLVAIASTCATTLVHAAGAKMFGDGLMTRVMTNASVNEKTYLEPSPLPGRP